MVWKRKTLTADVWISQTLFLMCNKYCALDALLIAEMDFRKENWKM